MFDFDIRSKIQNEGSPLSRRESPHSSGRQTLFSERSGGRAVDYRTPILGGKSTSRNCYTLATCWALGKRATTRTHNGKWHLSHWRRCEKALTPAKTPTNDIFEKASDAYPAVIVVGSVIGIVTPRSRLSLKALPYQSPSNLGRR